MRKRILIRIHRDEGVSWVVQDGEPEAPAVLKQGTLEEVAAGVAGAKVIVLVPSNDVLLAAVTLPATQRRRLLTVLPFALEDQLADDVENLHFALGKRDEADQWNTAVVDLTLMNNWLGRLAQAGIQADALVPDVFALPWREGEWSVLLEDDVATLRTGDQAGLCLDTGNFDAMLRAMLDSLGDLKPSRLNVLDCRLHAPAPYNPDIPIEVDVMEAHEPPVAYFAKAYEDGMGIDLLQGQFSRREQLSKYWRPWRAAASLLVAVLVVQMAGAGFERWQLSKELARLQTDVKNVYLTTFEGAKNVPDPRGQMEQKLRELRGGPAGGGALFGLLAKAGPQFKAIPGVEIERVNYRAGEITVSITLQDLQKLDQLKQKLVDQSLAVDIQSATSKDGKVEARLQIGGKQA